MKKTLAFYQIKYRSMLVSGTLTMAIVCVMLITDSVIAGQMFGHMGASAVNIVMPLVGFSVFVSACIPEGLAILYTRAIGAMDREKANRLFGMGLIASAVLAAVLALLVMGIRETYFRHCGASGMLLQYAQEYYAYLPLYAFLLPLSSYIEQMVYSDGDEKLEAVAYTVQIAGNVVLSVLLANAIGISGIMLGSVFGYLISILIMAIHFLKKSNTLHFVPWFSLKALLKCLKLSITDAVVYLLWGIMDFVLIRYITQNHGEQYLAILVVIYSLVEMSAVFDGIGMAIQPLISVYFGEKNYTMIRRLMKEAIRTAFAEGVIATALAIVFAPQLARLFGIADEAMLAPAVRAIRIVATTLTVTSLFMLATSYYLYIDRVWLSVGALILKDGVACTLMPIAFSRLFGVDGLWMGFALAPLAGFGASMLMIYLMRGRERFPWLIKNNEKDTFVYDAQLTWKNMMKAALSIQAQMEGHGYSKRDALLASLFAEEISATLLEVNGDDDVVVEYSLLFAGNSVRQIIRDSGIVFDVTDPELKITGLSSFVINRLLNAKEDKDYIPTVGYNRNLIRFEKVYNRAESQ